MICLNGRNSRILPKRIPLLLTARRFAANWYYAIDVPVPNGENHKYKTKDLPQEFKQFTKQDTIKLQLEYSKYLVSPNKAKHLIDVSEDNLFSVDFKKMELKPIYWDGPSYEVRRGIWFKNGKNPIPETLSMEVEKLSHQFKIDDPDVSIFKLNNDQFEDIKYVLFNNPLEAYLLPHLNNGSMHLKLLRSGLSQYLPMDGIRITRYKDNKESDHSIDKHQDVKIETKEKSDTSSSDNISSWLNWNFYNQLPSLWTTRSSEEPQVGENISNVPDSIESAYEDQNKSSTSSNNRKINHLVLCVHGIGQTLGKKYEYVNFAHTVNLLRTNMKKLYEVSPFLRSLNKNNKDPQWENNCGVQVLPITWRHSIGFETEPLEENKKTPELPILADITVKGILPLRKWLGDVAVDAILYEEPFYRERILAEVCEQLNKTFQLFKDLNKEFNGDVHVIGHSLGSVILFDILKDSKKYNLKFDVKKFFCLGSPIGLLKLIQRTRIIPINEQINSTISIDQPVCADMYNVYHACDPIAYRMEPLIHPSMKNVEHEILPHFTEMDGITSKVLQMGGNIFENIPTTENKEETSEKNVSKDVKKIIPEAHNLLTKLNHLGRVDFAMYPNILEADIIAAIKSHVSYFEEPDIAGFILKEIINT